MNFDMIIPEMTPAIARKIMWALPSSRAYVDPKIIELSQKDCFYSDGLTYEENHLAQFILDSEYRCVIPFKRQKDHDILKRTITHLIKDEPIVVMSEYTEWSNLGMNFHFQVLTRDTPTENIMKLRDRIWISPFISHEHAWITKIIPRLIITGQHQYQKSLFANVISDDSAIEAAIMLTPALNAIPTKVLTNIKPEHMAKLGIYSRFITETSKK